MDLNVTELKKKPGVELVEMALKAGVEDPAGLRRQQLIFKIIEAHIGEDGNTIVGEGVLEKLPDGFGFLRSGDFNYLPSPDDIYVSPSQIRRFGMRNGDTVMGANTLPQRRRKILRPVARRTD